MTRPPVRTEAHPLAAGSAPALAAEIVEMIRTARVQVAQLVNARLTLLHWQIQSMLYERTALSAKPEELVRRELSQLREGGPLTPDLVLQDPYILDFLGLADTYSERDLESALLRDIERFLLELGTGMAFRPADKGQVELYLRWLDRHERQPEEEAPIAIILCADKKHETVEYLDLGRSGIHVAQYLTELPSRDVLRARFQLALATTRARPAVQDPQAADDHA